MSKCKMPGESIECKPTQPELVDNANFLGDTFMNVVLWLVTNEINNKSFFVLVLHLINMTKLVTFSMLLDGLFLILNLFVSFRPYLHMRISDIPKS